MALRSALGMLKQDAEGKECIDRIVRRLHAFSYHLRSYFWLDFKQLNDIYRYKTEEYSHTAVNKFNVIPDSIPEWVFDFMPNRGGYFIGNVSPARMDFRWFCLGNCVAILSSLATHEQAMAIMDLIEARWEELVGEMPLKISYPAIEGHEWRIVTGCDPKNTRWSYHNGGSWPGLLFFFFLLQIIQTIPLLYRWSLTWFPSSLSIKNSTFVVTNGRMHQSGSSSDRETCNWSCRDPTSEGQLAWVLRWETREIRWETVEEVSNLVDSGLLGGKDVAGGSFSFGYDFNGRRQAIETGVEEIFVLVLLKKVVASTLLFNLVGRWRRWWVGGGSFFVCTIRIGCSYFDNKCSLIINAVCLSSWSCSY